MLIALTQKKMCLFNRDFEGVVKNSARGSNKTRPKKNNVDATTRTRDASNLSNQDKESDPPSVLYGHWPEKDP